MISVGSPGRPGNVGSVGRVITDGSCGNGYAPGDEVLVAVGVMTSVVDGAGTSVVIVEAVCCGIGCSVGGTIVVVLDGGEVVAVGAMVMAGSAAGRPRRAG